MALFGWQAGVALPWLLPALAVTLYVVWQTHRQEREPAYLRWQGDQLRLFDEPNLTSASDGYQWNGRGRRNRLYIRLELLNEESLRHDLVIWRDSVTDANWRSLNAAYRVNRSLFDAKRTARR